MPEFTLEKIKNYLFIVGFILLFDFVVLAVYKKVARRFLRQRKFLSHAIMRIVVHTFFLSQLLVLLPLCVLYYRNGIDKLGISEYLWSGLEQSFILLLFFLIKNIKRLLLEGKVLFYQKQKRRTVRRLASTFYIALFFWGILLFEQIYIQQLIALKAVRPLIFSVLKLYTIWCSIGMLSYAFHLGVKYYDKVLERKKMSLIKILLEATHWPVIMLCVVFTLLKTVDTIVEIVRNYDASLVADWAPFLSLSTYYHNAFLLGFIYTAFGLVRSLQHEFLSGAFTRIAPNKTMVVGLGIMARGLLGLIACLVVWNALNEEKTGIGTILGSTGIGLAIVLRPIIENYIAGVVNYFEGNYNIGDWVYFTDRKIEGVIEEIGARTIALRTFDKRALYIPHILFITHGVVNAGRMTHRRVFQKIPVGWITDSETLDRILADIRSLVYNSPDFDKKQALMVHFTGFGTLGLEITIYALTKTKNWHASLNVQEHILKEARKIIAKHAGAPPMQVVNYNALPQLPLR